jgi:hypothetical protein
MYILIIQFFLVPDEKTKDPKWQQDFSIINLGLLLTYSWMKFRFARVIPKHLALNSGEDTSTCT